MPPLALWVRGTGPAGRARRPVGRRRRVTRLDRLRRARRRRARPPAGGAGLDGRLRRRLRHRRRRAPRRAGRRRRRRVAVLACGVDRPYPAAHGALFSRIAETGLLVSEWPPGSAPLRHRFLVRNRLIAALTRGTVVVEAAARSGAQATARRARRPGPGGARRPRPGHLGDERRLPRAAARRGDAAPAGRLGRPRDRGGGRASATTSPRPCRARHGPRDGLSDLAARVLDACPVRNGVSPERLAAVAGCDVLEVLRVLPALELADLVQWTGTGWRLAPPPAGPVPRGPGAAA